MSERRRFESASPSCRFHYGWCCLSLHGRIVVSSSLWTFGLLLGPGHSGPVLSFRGLSISGSDLSCPRCLAGVRCSVFPSQWLLPELRTIQQLPERIEAVLSPTELSKDIAE